MYPDCIQLAYKLHTRDSPRYARCVHHVCMDEDEDWPPDPFNRRPKVSASRRAYLHVREQILDGRLQGTALLSECEVAGELGMSRTPVRAAFGQLEAEGYLKLYP